MSQQPEDDLLRDFHTDLSVGDILRRARLRSGLSLDQIELEIRISKAHLLAIEEGKLEQLPGRVYALGFIRTYADHLALDGEKIMSLLKRQSGPKIEPKHLTPSFRQVSEDFSLPGVNTLIMLTFILIGILIASPYINGQIFINKGQVPSLPKELKEQITLLSKPTVPVAPTSANTPAAATEKTPPQATENIAQNSAHPVILKAISNVWLEIRTAQRKTIFSRVLSAGEEYWVPQDQTGLVMTLGNAGGLRIIVDGNELPFLGLTGQVVRNIALDPERLKERLKIPEKKPM